MNAKNDTGDGRRWERREDSLGTTIKLCPKCEMWSSAETDKCPICGNEEGCE